HDITRIKAIEEELRMANVGLEARVRERTSELQSAQLELLRQERLAVLGRLAGGLAHQIRNPLPSIANAALVLRRLLPHDATPDDQRAIAIILEETTHANKIITDLLDYARIRPPNRCDVDLTELVHHVVSNCNPDRQVRVVIDLDDVPHVAADV